MKNKSILFVCVLYDSILLYNINTYKRRFCIFEEIKYWHCSLLSQEPFDIEYIIYIFIIYKNSNLFYLITFLFARGIENIPHISCTQVHNILPTFIRVLKVKYAYMCL